MRLRNYFTLYTVGCLGIVLVLSVVGLLIRHHQQSMTTQAALIGTLARTLEVQLLGIEADGVFRARFPDWQVINRSLEGTNGCARLLRPDRSLWRSVCHGTANSSNVPRVFVKLYLAAFANAEPLSREIHDARSVVATLELLPDYAANAALAWRTVTQIGTVVALSAFILSAMHMRIARKVIVSTDGIVDGLERIAAGDLAAELTPSSFSEFARISAAVNELVAGLRASEASRYVLGARLLQSQDDERQTIARELHDEFAQHLTAVAALSTAIRHASVNDPEIASDAARIEDIVAVLHRHLRQLLTSLRPPGLLEIGLSGSLRQLVRTWRQQLRDAPDITLRLDGALDEMPTGVSSHAYRIVQECITNGMRHAGSAAIEASLCRRPATVNDTVRSPEVLDIQVRSAKRAESSVPREGHGLRGIEERVAALHGKLILSYDPQYIVRVLVPLHTADSAEPA